MRRTFLLRSKWQWLWGVFWNPTLITSVRNFIPASHWGEIGGTKINKNHVSQNPSAHDEHFLTPELEPATNNC